MRATRWPWTMATTLTLSFGLTGCGELPAAIDEEEELDDGKYEAWNQANNPSYVDQTFVYELDKLPLTGNTKNPPIPADYWPTYKDNLNQRWDGDQPSPAEKWEKAFNKAGVQKAITDNHGIRGIARKECSVDSDCADLKDGSNCAIPRGETKGRCIPTWWGICHGWAPYAFSEPAPRNPVVKNGVTFYPGDLEGLMSLAYSNGLPVKFLSQRCNKKEPGFDNTGRVVDAECRDMNPGSWHIVVTNMLGLRQTGFVYDRTAFDQVWNQPVRRFKIVNAENGKLKEITKAEAVALLGLDKHFDQLLAETDYKKGDKKVGEFVATADGEVVFKTAGAGDVDLYVKKGAAATEADSDCRSTGGTSAEECKIFLKKGEKAHYLLLGYADNSKASLSVGTIVGAPNYVYNPAAKRFFFVSMDFDYITEARTARASRLDEIDNHTVTDHMEYIVEADDRGRVIGGEWTGDSRNAHPDFVWWPTGKPRPSIASGLITYDEIKKLNDESAGMMMPGAGTEEKELAKNVTVNRVSHYATIGVAGGKTLTVKMTGTGNADLYVRLGAKPTVSSFGCKSTNSGSAETCSIKAPPAGGTYYVRARPIATSTVSIVATISN